jgi:hypothetical protein
VAHALAQPLDVSPWDALLGEVRRTAGAVAWLDRKVASAVDDDDLRPGGSHFDWVRMRDKERMWLGRVSKMAVDAGVSAMLVSRETAAGEELAAVFNRTIEALRAAGLSDELETVARSAFRSELMALDSSQPALPSGD